MKLIGRTLIILLAALIVCGAAYAIEGGRASGPGGFPQRGSFQEQRGPGNLPTGTFRRPEGPGGRGDRGGSWLGGIFELLRSLLIVAVVAAISLPFVRLLQRRQGKDQLTDEPSSGDYLADCRQPGISGKVGAIVRARQDCYTLQTIRNNSNAPASFLIGNISQRLKGRAIWSEMRHCTICLWRQLAQYTQPPASYKRVTRHLRRHCFYSCAPG